MNVIYRRAITFYIDHYPKAKKQLEVWYEDFVKHDFANFNEIKNTYGNASIIANNRAVFNIKGNDFRLIVSFNFKQEACFIIWFGTHNEYDKIDAETIPFNKAIQNYKTK
jgi:mRNA interferase HigB